MDDTRYVMRLLGGFDLRRNRVGLDLPVSSQRLLALLALNPRPQPRGHVADVLWPDVDAVHANANLRTALWRLRNQEHELVDCHAGALTLSERVWVDTRALHAAIVRHARSGELPDPTTLVELRGELLPGCWDAWLVFDRERFRQEAVHLLEQAAESCLTRGDSHRATVLGLCAVQCDELRESATVLLLRALLADGNTGRAVHEAMRFAARLEDELGISPPEFVEELLWKHRKALRHRTTAEVAG